MFALENDIFPFLYLTFVLKVIWKEKAWLRLRLFRFCFCMGNSSMHISLYWTFKIGFPCNLIFSPLHLICSILIPIELCVLHCRYFTRPVWVFRSSLVEIGLRYMNMVGIWRLGDQRSENTWDSFFKKEAKEHDSKRHIILVFMNRRWSAHLYVLTFFSIYFLVRKSPPPCFHNQSASIA